VLRPVGLVATFVVALLAAAVAVIGFRAHGAEMPAETIQGNVPALALTFAVTPLSAPFCALLAILATAVALWSARRGGSRDPLLIAFFTATMLLVLVARSVALFFFAWEAMSLVSAFLVAAHHERRGVRRATFTYLVVAQTGALCVLVALTLLALAAGDTSFAGIAAHAARLSPGLRDSVFVFALLGFGSKAGLMPLHFWLPRAHPVAPASASAMLSGAMLKVALYGLLVVTLELAAPGPSWWGITLVAIGTVSAVGGVLYALVDHDLKRLLAYHSVENVGIIVIGIGVALLARSSGSSALAGLALVAALFHIINHGLFKALLFLGAGTVNEVEGTVDLERLGGLWGELVWTAPFFLIGCAAITGLPPFNGFASEWLTFQSLVGGVSGGGLTATFVLVAAIAGLALTGGLAAACFVKVFGVVFLGGSRRLGARPELRERLDSSTIGVGLLAGLCIVLGVVPTLAVVPLAGVVGETLGLVALTPPTLPVLPATLALLPLVGALLCVVMAARRGVRSVPTWTCGSPVTAAAQYTATAFSKPLLTVFAFVLLPQRQRRYEMGSSRWFPERILYRTESRYVVDEVARRFAALVLRFARRSRLVQSGSLRIYVAYAVAALIVTVALAR
jgi:hydrogenase-4 component B